MSSRQYVILLFLASRNEDEEVDGSQQIYLIDIAVNDCED